MIYKILKNNITNKINTILKYLLAKTRVVNFK